MRFLMCRPNYYGIHYEINPWMNIKLAVDHKKAEVEWEKLYQKIIATGAKVDLIPPVQGWPDMVFTANAGLYYQKKIILPHFKYKEREGEKKFFKTWFIEAGFACWEEETINQPAYFEGAGDALPAGDILFAGFGFRTDRRFYEQASYLHQDQVIYCELVDPYYYHIDTCFCPLNEKSALWFPPAFSNNSRKVMEQKIQCIPVVEEEAMRFACNAVVINHDIFIPSGCPQITRVLEQRGFTVHANEMEEFLKAGGACKCLTLRID